MSFHPTLSKSGRILFWPVIKICEFMGNHFPTTLLKIRYWYVFKTPLNLKNPKDINEKILWGKLYSDTSRWTELADKRKVRDYVESMGLGDTLVKLYATWYRKEDVNFDELPETFIIKANNGDGKGTNKIIRKSELTPKKSKEYIDLIGQWLRRKNIGALHAEPHYKHMPPCVIAEEVLPFEAGATSLTDYKIWCFNGKAYYICVYSDRSEQGDSAEYMVYDKRWNAHPEVCAINPDFRKAKLIPKPKNFERMIEIAERLSQGFPELRVDLYNIDGKIYFGELTFTSQGGFMDYFTPDFKMELGSRFNIKDFPGKF